MHYYQFHIGDFRSATLHLSNAEELTYRRLLDWYYDTETPIPLDTQWVSRRLRICVEDLESVLKDFFIETPEGWVNARCQAEIAGYQGLVEKNRENGKKGGRPRKNKNPVGFNSVPSGNPDESQKKPNHEPITMNQEEIKSSCDQQAESLKEPVMKIPYEEILDSFKLRLPGFPQPRRPLDEDRRKAIRTIWAKQKQDQYGAVDFFDRYFNFVSETEFLTSWKGCSFDWLFNYKNFRKVCEGNYEGDKRGA